MPLHPLAEEVIANVTVSVVKPEFVMVCIIFPVPFDAKPVRLGELGEAVQLNVVPGTWEVSKIFVVCPEQIAGVVELITIFETGYTVTTYVAGEGVVQPPTCARILKVTVSVVNPLFVMV